MISRIIKSFLAFLIACSLYSCGVGYGFTSVAIPENIKTFQVDFFEYQAALVEPGIERTFRIALQDQIQDQSSLSLVTSKGDYIYQGAITRYFIAPITATADNTASQNRLTIEINVRFTNTKDDEASFEKSFSFFHDYNASAPMQGATLDIALEIIYEQITQDVVNATLANW
jgi:hypothetical protein